MQGLKPSQLAALTRLFNRRFPAEEVYTVDQARELSLLSRAVGRQLGLLIDRKGRVQMVIVGEAGSIMIPELPRGRSGQERLRGLRLLHTHLNPGGINQEDLMDMLFLRLDAVVALTVLYRTTDHLAHRDRCRRRAARWLSRRRRRRRAQ